MFDHEAWGKGGGGGKGGRERKAYYSLKFLVRDVPSSSKSLRDFAHFLPMLIYSFRAIQFSAKIATPVEEKPVQNAKFDAPFYKTYPCGLPDMYSLYTGLPLGP